MEVESSYWASDDGQLTGDSNIIMNGHSMPKAVAVAPRGRRYTQASSQPTISSAGRGARPTAPLAGYLEILDGNRGTFGEGFALSGFKTRGCYQPPPPPRRPPRPWPSP